MNIWPDNVKLFSHSFKNWHGYLHVKTCTVFKAPSGWLWEFDCRGICEWSVSLTYTFFCYTSVNFITLQFFHSSCHCTYYCLNDYKTKELHIVALPLPAGKAFKHRHSQRSNLSCQQMHLNWLKKSRKMSSKSGCWTPTQSWKRVYSACNWEHLWRVRLSAVSLLKPGIYRAFLLILFVL